MTELVSLDFPSVMRTRYRGVPKRYEETKPVVVQNFTHQRILGIGNNVHRQSLQRLEDDKMLCIKHAEDAVWKQAEGHKEEAVRKARIEAKLELESAMKKIIREQDHKIKEEALKVEMAMQKLSIDQIKAERANAEIQLKAALVKNEEKCSKQLQQAVESAHQEEKKKARSAAVQLTRKYSANIEAMKRKLSKDKEEAIDNVIQQKDVERRKAVQDAIDQEVINTNIQIELLIEQHQQEINRLEKVITEKDSVIQQVKHDIRKVEILKSKAQEKIIETRQEFQFFIDRMQFFDHGQSDYLLPSLNLNELES